MSSRPRSRSPSSPPHQPSAEPPPTRRPRTVVGAKGSSIGIAQLPSRMSSSPPRPSDSPLSLTPERAPQPEAKARARATPTARPSPGARRPGRAWIEGAIALEDSSPPAAGGGIAIRGESRARLRLSSPGLGRPRYHGRAGTAALSPRRRSTDPRCDAPGRCRRAMPPSLRRSAASSRGSSRSTRSGAGGAIVRGSRTARGDRDS